LRCSQALLTSRLDMKKPTAYKVCVGFGPGQPMTEAAR
jgi:hypothetical protein